MLKGQCLEALARSARDWPKDSTSPSLISLNAKLQQRNQRRSHNKQSCQAPGELPLSRSPETTGAQQACRSCRPRGPHMGLAAWTIQSSCARGEWPPPKGLAMKPVKALVLTALQSWCVYGSGTGTLFWSITGKALSPNLNRQNFRSL